MMPLLVLALSGCQTTDDIIATNTVAPPSNSWGRAPLSRSDNAGRSARADGMALTGYPPAGKTTYVEGTGRFLGDQGPALREVATDAAEDGITLNLINVPAPQAAKTVLGDILAVKYTVDPAIEGKLTIQTPKPVPKSAVIELFQAALRSNGATVINTGDYYKVVPVDQAAIGAPINVGTTSDAGERLGSGLKIVQLKYVSASEIRRVLEPIAPRGGIVRADDARHAITLSGNNREIAGMLEAISIFDVDVMKGMSFSLMPVRISDPAVIADELKTVFASEREGPMAGMVRFLPNKRLGAILVISAQPQYLRRAETWVRRLDAQAEGSEKQFFTYPVQNRRAQELVGVLQSMFAKETGARTAAVRNVSPQFGEASVQSASAQTSGQTVSQGFATFGGGSAAGTPSAAMAGGAGSTGLGQTPSAPGNAETGTASATDPSEGADEPRIKLAADDAQNAILIEATRADYLRIMRMVGSLDVMPNQVLIEATIAEVSLNDDLKFGLRWYLQGKNSSQTFTDDASGAVSSVFPGFSYALTAANITASLNALNTITDVNVISSPTLTVLDNKTATLQIGDQVPITTQSAVGVVGTGSPIVKIGRAHV